MGGVEIAPAQQPAAGCAAAALRAFIYPIRGSRGNRRRRRPHGSSANVARPSDPRGLVGRTYPAALGRSLDLKNSRDFVAKCGQDVY